jgi:hypothetical protein
MLTAKRIEITRVANGYLVCAHRPGTEFETSEIHVAETHQVLNLIIREWALAQESKDKTP